MLNIKKIKDHVRSDNDSYRDIMELIWLIEDAIQKLDKYNILIHSHFPDLGNSFLWLYRSKNKYSHANSINLHIGISLGVSEDDELIARILLKTTRYHKYSIPDVDWLSRKENFILDGEEDVMEIAEEIISIAEMYSLIDQLLPKLRPNLQSKAIDLLPI
jgi:hypothetical protein